MTIRDLNLNDLVILEEHAKFPLPNLSSPLYCIKKSIEDDKKLIGSFWVKVTSETSLVINPNLSNLTRARGIKKLFEFLSQELVRVGLDDSHLFIQNNNHFTEILKRHFNFKDNLGNPLYISSQEVKHHG